VKLDGRILWLLDDADLLRSQLEGQDLSPQTLPSPSASTRMP
jgi:hypothetical protein